MSETLKPCPFCGFDDEEPTHNKHGTPYCPNCGAVGPDSPEAWGESGDDIADNHDVLWNRRAAPAIPASVVESLQSENAALRAKLETERQERIAAMVSAEGARKDAEMLARLIEELVLKHRAKNSCESCKHFYGGHGGANCIRCKRISQDRFEQAPAAIAPVPGVTCDGCLHNAPSGACRTFPQHGRPCNEFKPADGAGKGEA